MSAAMINLTTMCVHSLERNPKTSKYNENLSVKLENFISKIVMANKMRKTSEEYREFEPYGII